MPCVTYDNTTTNVIEIPVFDIGTMNKLEIWQMIKVDTLTVQFNAKLFRALCNYNLTGQTSK